MEDLKQVVDFYRNIEDFKCGLDTGKITIAPRLYIKINHVLFNLETSGTIDKVEIPFQDKVLLYELDSIFKTVPSIKFYQRKFSCSNDKLDISRLVSLKNLEFNTVSVENVHVLDESINELIVLIFIRCCNVLSCLKKCNVWSNVRTLTINYCNLTVIEDGILDGVKNVENMDLSFNQLKCVDGIKSLENLINLNLSFNALESVPTIPFRSALKLEILNLGNNNLIQLNGIEILAGLKILFLNDNCIYNKQVLANLYFLKQLQNLHLYGNPLSLHKYYRMYVVHFIGTSYNPFQFKLDNKPLRDAELDFIGTFRGGSLPPQIYQSAIINSDENSLSVDLSPDILNESEKISETPQEESPVLARRVLKASKKSRKIREVIFEEENAIVSSSTPNSDTKKKKKKNLLIKKSEEVTLIKENEEKSTDLILQLPKELTESNSIETLNISDVKISSSDEVASQNEESPFIEECKHKKSVLQHEYPVQLHSSPESSVRESCMVEVTVHATETELEIELPNQDEVNVSAQELDLPDDNKETSASECTFESNVTTDNEMHYLTCDSTLLESSIAEEEISEQTLNTQVLANNETIKSPNTESGDKIFESSDDESEIENDNLSGEENLWPVKKVSDQKTTDIFLVLLDSELRERSTFSGRTISNYPLAFVRRCSKISEDPVTIEIEFMSLLKQKTIRTYIMEFPDSQTLMKKMSALMETSPKKSEIQRNFQCKSCDTSFVKDPDSVNTISRIICPLCESVAVDELEIVEPIAEEYPFTVEEPCNQNSSNVEEPFGQNPSAAEEPFSQNSSAAEEPFSQNSSAAEEPFSQNSSSPSSIVTTSVSGNEATGSPPTNTNQNSEPSSDRSGKSSRSGNGQKCESDIEIISNPSQSSIEVIDEYARSPETQIHRKLLEFQSSNQTVLKLEVTNDLNRINNNNDSASCELVLEACDQTAEEQTLVKPSITVPLPQLTESSSSGSVSESVVTTYEAAVTGLKELSDSGIEDVQEANTLPLTNADVLSTESNTGGVAEVQDCDNEKKIMDIETFNYENLTDVDHRIKVFLYQYVFNDVSEELTLLIKCHVWKTGGIDYPALFILSTSKMYILMITSKTLGWDVSNWLSLKESNDLKSIKQIFMLIWHQGLGLAVNHYYYFILLQNKSYTENLLSSIKALPLKGCDIVNKPNSKVELSLQQLILSCNYLQEVIDPTILLYTICSAVILKDDEVREIMRLCGFVVTAGEFYLVVGDFCWLTGTSELPTIDFFQRMSSLIEVDRRGCELRLHFLDESEAIEEVWALTCSNIGQVNTIVESMKVPWENLFSVPLEVSYSS